MAVLRHLLDIDDYRNLALVAGRIVRSLATDSYRRHEISLHGGEDSDEDDEADYDHTVGDAAHGRPYFEVLVVDNGEYGTIRTHQERRFPGRPVATALRNPDFVEFARSFGMQAVRTTD